MSLDVHLTLYPEDYCRAEYLRRAGLHSPSVMTGVLRCEVVVRFIPLLVGVWIISEPVGAEHGASALQSV